MSTEYILQFILQKLNIYFCLFILILGVFGGICNVIIFISLKTFRETTCGFYLTINSIVNIGQLVTTLLIRVLSKEFYIDPQKILWICKISYGLGHWYLLMMSTTICLATVDQFLSMTKYRYISNLRIARYCTIIASILWSTHAILFFIYINTFTDSCGIININFSIYISRFYYPIILGCLPTSIMVIFSLLAFYNVRILNRQQQVNIVRLKRDRQLTAMVLVYVIYIVMTKLPHIIFYIYYINLSNTDQEKIILYFIYSITITLNYTNYASSFYIFCCVSKRFRKQLIYVFIDVWLNRLRKWVNTVNNNQIVPITKIRSEDYPVETILATVEIELRDNITK